MEGKDSPQNVIDNYQRRQQWMPFVIGGVAILLIMIGVIVMIVWLAGPNRPAFNPFASATPTATETFTPTPTVPTATPTFTATFTLTPTVTSSPTASGPFEYVILANDNCYDIASKFNVDLAVLLAINNFKNACPIQPGQKIMIPAPGQKLPTETPLPTNIARGTKIEYTIQLGDTLASIASKFDANIETIKTDNNITDANSISAGDVLIIRVREVTPTRTVAPTSTPASTSNPAAAATTQPTTSGGLSLATITPTP
ncbi:MAG: LysM peptidoglycan-binding domain-containing protein [Anaerolineae bacterium]|nr:LysM peptidoglycan-binding domain-containing protein [Anaerolineae bacterium]